MVSSGGQLDGMLSEAGISESALGIYTLLSSLPSFSRLPFLFRPLFLFFFYLLNLNFPSVPGVHEYFDVGASEFIAARAGAIAPRMLTRTNSKREEIKEDREGKRRKEVEKEPTKEKRPREERRLNII